MRQAVNPRGVKGARAYKLESKNNSRGDANQGHAQQNGFFPRMRVRGRKRQETKMLILFYCWTFGTFCFWKACNFKVGVTWIFGILNIIEEERFFSILRITTSRCKIFFDFSGRWNITRIIVALETTRAMISIVATRSYERPPRDWSGYTFWSPGSWGFASSKRVRVVYPRWSFPIRREHSSPSTVTRVPALSIMESRRSSCARTHMSRLRVLTLDIASTAVYIQLSSIYRSVKYSA